MVSLDQHIGVLTILIPPQKVHQSWIVSFSFSSFYVFVPLTVPWSFRPLCSSWLKRFFSNKKSPFFFSSSHLYFRHPLLPALTGASHPSCVWSPMISDQWVLMCFWSAWSTISPLTSDIAHHLSFSYSTAAPSTTYISSLTYLPAARSVLLTTWSEGRIIDRIAAFSPNYQYLEYWLPQKALTPH